MSDSRKHMLRPHIADPPSPPPSLPLRHWPLPIVLFEDLHAGVEDELGRLYHKVDACLQSGPPAWYTRRCVPGHDCHLVRRENGTGRQVKGLGRERISVPV